MRSAVLRGVAGWTAYATIETAFASVAPYLVHPHSAYLPVHPGTTAALLAIYAAVGAVVGLIVSALLPRGMPEDQFLRAAAALVTISIVVAIEANLIAQIRGVSLTGSLIVAAVVIVLAGTRTAARYANPWTASLLLLGPVWLARDAFPAASAKWKAIIALTLVVATVALAHLACRFVRNRRPSIALVMAAWVLTFAITLLLAQPVPSLPPKSTTLARNAPNVILITLDTVRADHLSVYGYLRDTTPSLRDFAAHSTLFREPIAASNMTPATHAAIMTGRWPSTNGDYYESGATAPVLPDSTVTLAKVLRRHGYSTAAIVANYAFLGDDFGITQGFQYLDARAASPFFAEPPAIFLRYAAYRVLRSQKWTPDAENPTRDATTIDREAFHVIGRLSDRHAPFFLFLNYMDAHGPYITREPFASRFPGRDVSVWTTDLTMTLYERARDLLSRGQPLDHVVRENERANLLSRYDAAIAYLDDQLGVLIAGLKTRGLYDNTLLIITADHGEAFGERGFIGHGTSAYEDQTFVPLLIKFPDQQAGRVENAAVSSVDIFPTVLEIAHVSPSFAVDGTSLVPPDPVRRLPVISEAFPLTSTPPARAMLWSGRAIVAGGKKLLLPTAGNPELYEVDNDPAETRNIAATMPGVVADLRQRLASATIAIAVRKPPPLTNDAARKLRALGYLN